MDRLLALRRQIMMARKGSLPVFYDFIGSANGAIVDTGIYIPSLGSLEIQVYASASFGSRGVVGTDDGNGGITSISLQTSGGARRWTCIYDGGSAAGRNGGSLNSRLYCGLTPYKYFGSMSTTNITKGSTPPATTLKLFYGVKGNYANELLIGPVYIYGSDAKDSTSIATLETFTPIASFLPCKVGTITGFWYVEGGYLLGNTGSGTLTAFNI